jgi:hypothetical protein
MSSQLTDPRSTFSVSILEQAGQALVPALSGRMVEKMVEVSETSGSTEVES